MNSTNLKRIVLLFLVPLLFLFYYLFILIANDLSLENTLYVGLSGSELVLVGIIAILEFVFEIYFSRPNVTEASKKEILDKEFVINIVGLITALVFYALLKIEATVEIESLNSKEGPNNDFLINFYASLIFGLATMMFGYRTFNKLNSIA